jgi:hypothetical protein
MMRGHEGAGAGAAAPPAAATALSAGDGGDDVRSARRAGPRLPAGSSFQVGLRMQGEGGPQWGAACRQRS